MPNIENLESLVKIRNLSFFREERVIFSEVNMDIMRGKVTAVMGPSGTGKTTLLQLIGGILCPSQGSIEVNNHDINQLSRRELYQLRCNMGMLFQNGALFTNLSVFENVAFPLRAHTLLSEKEIHDTVLQKLDAVMLKETSALRANQLSGGMARRVALARAIALNPMLIMYDEPFAGLDPIALSVIVKLIRTLNDEANMTTILVSHDVNETLHIADYVYLIDEAKIIAQGTPRELLKHTDTQVQHFLYGMTDQQRSKNYLESICSSQKNPVEMASC